MRVGQNYQAEVPDVLTRGKNVLDICIANEPPDSLFFVAVIRRKQSRNGLFLLVLIISLQLRGG